MFCLNMTGLWRVEEVDSSHSSECLRGKAGPLHSCVFFFHGGRAKQGRPAPHLNGHIVLPAP